MSFWFTKSNTILNEEITQIRIINGNRFELFDHNRICDFFKIVISILKLVCIQNFRGFFKKIYPYLRWSKANISQNKASCLPIILIKLSCLLYERFQFFAHQPNQKVIFSQQDICWIAVLESYPKVYKMYHFAQKIVKKFCLFWPKTFFWPSQVRVLFKILQILAVD